MRCSQEPVIYPHVQSILASSKVFRQVGWIIGRLSTDSWFLLVKKDFGGGQELRTRRPMVMIAVLGIFLCDVMPSTPCRLPNYCSAWRDIRGRGR